MISEQEVLAVFQETGAYLTGHFLLSSGRHSEHYLQCAKVLQYPDKAERLCRALAAEFLPLSPTAVVAPALGGVVVSYELARHLPGSRGVFTERKDDAMQLRRGFELGPRDRVVVVEDVVTTAGSVREVIAVVAACRAQLVGVGSLVNRSGQTPSFDVPFKSLLSLQIPTYPAQECPFCARGVPLVKPGSRASLDAPRGSSGRAG